VNFLHASLIAGAAFAIIPVLIHVTGRRQPKTIVFPALQFVRATQLSSARGWNLKRILLLALRVALLLLLALALASPRVHQASYANWLSIGLLGILGFFAAVVAAVAFARHSPSIIKYGAILVATLLLTSAGVWSAKVIATGPSTPMQSSSGPVAAVLIVDTSPTMEYRFENKTRLELANEHAHWIIGRLDDQSEIAVLAGNPSDRLQLGHVAAERNLDQLRIEGATVNLTERIRKAIDLLKNTKLDRREIYVVTDLSASAWQQTETDLKALLADGEPILLQIVNVGTQKVSNLGIDQVQINQDVVQSGGTIQIEASINAAKDTAPQQVILELLAEKNEPGLPRIADGKLIVAQSQVIGRQVSDSTPQGTSINFSFQIDNLPIGTNNYQLRLTTSDPLQIDDSYAFTIEGIESGKILVVDGSNAINANSEFSDAATLALMLDPYSSNVQTVSLSQLANQSLKGFSIVAIHNPSLNISDGIAKGLDEFVNEGGNLILSLGDAIDPRSVPISRNTGLASLLPGAIERQTRSTDRNVYLENIDRNHPIWAGFGRELDTVPWSRYPVYRHWDIDVLNAGARPISQYTISGQPAIIEEVRGRGRIITFTTPIPDTERASHETWNELTSAPDNWVAFGTVLGIGNYLQASADMHRNFTVAQTALVQWNDTNLPDRFELFNPDGTSEQVRVENHSILYGFTRYPGFYRLRSLSPNTTETRGFAVHLAPGATSLERIDSAQLNEILGEDSYVLANDRESLQHSIGNGRYGRDMAPFLMLLIAGLFFAEQAMAQNFYVPQRWKWMTGHA
jgi:hypothetical protein